MKSPKSSDVHPPQFRRLRGWLRGERGIFEVVRLFLLSIKNPNMKNLLLLTLFITFILQGCGGELVYNKEYLNIIQSEGILIYKGEFYSGKFIKYYDDGTLSKVEEKGSYLNGKQNGVWEAYFDNGQLMLKSSYLNGEKNGFFEIYNENGQLLSKGSYLNGKETDVWELYYDNGQLKMKGSYINRKMDGVWELYYENGELRSKGSYLNGEPHGVFEFYHENGQLWMKGSYINGKEDGVWKYYNEDGSLKSTKTH